MSYETGGRGYAELLESRFCKIIAVAMIGDYQGDEFYIVSQVSGGYGDEHRYGFGTSGYGSCSGCDAIEDAWGNADNAEALLDEHPDSYKDIDAVMEAQKDLVRIDHTLRQILNYKGV